MDYETSLEDSVSVSSTGSGGLSQYYLGTSIRVHKTLSIGINAFYLFGGLSGNKTADFNNTDMFNMSSVDRTNITGLSYETGLLFNTEIDKDKFCIALSFQNFTNLDQLNFIGYNI